MASKKIVCLGAGSLYFRRLLGDFALSRDLSGSEVVLYDLDSEKARAMEDLGKRLVSEAGTDLKLRTATDLSDAVDGADFAISSIGGSGAEVTRNVYDSYYHNADCHIPAKYGIHQVIGDTCGPAGMMMALRAIPAYIEICREMEKRCPNVVLFSHSNPMAVLCRAMHKYTDLTVIGICHGVQGGIINAGKILGLPPEELDCTWIGTNHYYWFTSIRHEGQDVYPELLERINQDPISAGQEMSTRLSRIYGHQIVYTPDDHIIEFYPFATQVDGDQDALPYGLAEQARKHGYDARKPMMERSGASAEEREAFFTAYRALLDTTALPKEAGNPLTEEGVARIISAIATGERQVCIVNVANQGVIPNLPATAEVEVEGVTDTQGVRPIHMGDAPLVLKGILEKRFVWQELVADAAVTGDRQTALQALMVDEMAIRPEKAEAMLDELLLASKELLPQFFPDNNSC